MIEKDLERLEEKLDKIDERLNSIDVTLAQQAVSLDTHIKRTDLLEDKVDRVDTYMKWQQGAWKLIGAAVVLASLVQIYLIVTRVIPPQ